ncbi:MAG: hypothetical protein AAB959_00255 [Patescibacteria group bacterium]
MEKMFLIFGSSVTYGAWDSEGGWANRLRSFLDMLDIIGYITRVKSVKKIQTKDGNIKWKSTGGFYKRQSC